MQRPSSGNVLVCFRCSMTSVGRMEEVKRKRVIVCLFWKILVAPMNLGTKGLLYYSVTCFFSLNSIV